MICVEDIRLDSDVERAHHEVLQLLARQHSIFRFSTVDALDAYLERGLDELHAAGLPRALHRVVLFCRHPRAIDAVSRRMLPGRDAIIYRVPDAWHELYGRIDQLRAQARLFGV
jgi:hypothetical protein